MMLCISRSPMCTEYWAPRLQFDEAFRLRPRRPQRKLSKCSRLFWKLRKGGYFEDSGRFANYVFHRSLLKLTSIDETLAAIKASAFDSLHPDSVFSGWLHGSQDEKIKKIQWSVVAYAIYRNVALRFSMNKSSLSNWQLAKRFCCLHGYHPAILNDPARDIIGFLNSALRHLQHLSNTHNATHRCLVDRTFTATL
ncbi:hypothetical protein CC80DRAFT_170149 [Byssothecium circinans]|uniref:Uncharacterized protein n=1 Tax=Byssothecium circinans TaxID=147558 RepID=A0A6A5TIX8_9PLEO|nr:hypothetical protein CC80DRAFT_170149 [Byssothecium circinans]